MTHHLPNHFFKFIPPNFKLNLSIPKLFLTNLDGRRDKKAILKRGGHKWSVHIGDGGVFGDGWSKFVEENGVEEFDFIVFKHEGNMVFDFFVFDSSSCERKYPNLPDEEVEICLTESDSLHTHESSKMHNKRKKRAECSSQTQSKDELRLDDDVDDRCFVTIITPYHIRTSRLNVPMKLARSNGLTTNKRHTQIVLVDEAKRRWPGTLDIKATQIHLTGWRKLIVEDDVKVGDTYMFELIEAGKVPIFNFYNLEKNPENNHTRVKNATSSTCYFISTLKPSSSERSFLYLPVEFSISNDLRKGQIILRDDEGRLWKVQLNKHGKSRFFLGRGFREFCVANGLTEGDAYKFELAENEKDKPPVVNFSYLGKKAVQKHIQLQETSSSIKKVTGLTPLQKEKCKPPVSKVDLASTPSKIEDRASYMGEVKSYCVEKSILYLPSEFAVKNGLFNKEEMILRNTDKRSWSVDIKRNKNYCYLGGRLRWREFAAANGLKEGTLFKLELVSNGEIPVANFYVLKVDH